VAQHVADHERDPAARQRNRVEPVAARFGAGAAGQVPLGHLDAGEVRRGDRRDGLLDLGDRHLLAAVQPGVVDAKGGLRGQLSDRQNVHFVERRTLGTAPQRDAAEHLPPQDQRHREIGAVVQRVLRKAHRLARRHRLAARITSAQGVGGVQGFDRALGQEAAHRAGRGGGRDGRSGGADGEQRFEQVEARGIGQPRHQRRGEPRGDRGHVRARTDLGRRLTEERQVIAQVHRSTSLALAAEENRPREF
jgi:hypothetical protein